jgi:diguanylate cyclase (GGDEF)-like protein
LSADELLDDVTCGTVVAQRAGMMPRPVTSTHEVMRQPAALAEVLRWQAAIRVGITAAVVTLWVALQALGVIPGSPAMLVTVVVTYAVVVVLAALGVRRWPSLSTALVTATVVADLAFIFGWMAASTEPVYYARSLTLAFLVLHTAEFYFGRRQARLAIAVVVLGYVALVGTAAARGAAINWAEEVRSIVVFLVAAVVFVNQYGDLRRRLSALVTLFERAEEGDFSQEYDAARDRRPDAITAVGRAYNRVRLQLASMVLTDPLTGCLNRRGFDQALARELARAERAGSEVALLALDLDHFKNVNDTLGHPAGDVVLAETGMLLKQTARGGDVVARTGGEEFTLLLPDTGASGAFQLASRLCDTVREHRYLAAGRSIRITVSVGAVTGPLGTAADPMGSELKRRADEALYAAKRSGRDRVRVWAAGYGVREEAAR